MTIRKRIQDFLMAMLQLFRVIILFVFPENGKAIVIGTFQLQLVLLGIRYLVFYFTMARHMVDGRAILYRGGIYLDLGIFLGFINVIPSAWVMVYLIGYFLLNAVYRCLKALDTRKIRDRKWIRTAVIAIWYLLMSVAGIANLQSVTAMVYLFCLEVTLSSVHKLAQAFRKTAIVYIQ